MAYKVNIERLFEIAKPRNEKAHQKFLERYGTRKNNFTKQIGQLPRGGEKQLSRKGRVYLHNDEDYARNTDAGD